MERRISIIFIIICLMLFSNGIYSQDKTNSTEKQSPAKSDKNKTDEEQPQTQPSKMYDLTPAYTKNMKWKEKVNLVIIQESSNYKSKSSIEMTTSVEVTDVKDYKPKSVKFEDVKGKRKIEYEYDGNPYSDENDFTEKLIKANIDENYCINSLDMDDESNVDTNLLMVYPTGNLPGFMPPMKPVKIGDTWKSDKITALNLKLVFEDYNDKVNISKSTSEFKLKSVEEKNKLEIATIVWTGKCTVQPPKGEEGTLELEWDIKIKFDLTNIRLLSTDSSVTMGLAELENMKLNYKLTRTLEYEKTDKKEKETEIKPKTDEDE